MRNKSAVAKRLSGTVTSDKMDRTITVMVERKVKHPLYRKYVKRSTKLLAHDENNMGRRGDFVTIEECRPISKRKSWKLLEVVTESDEA